MAELFISYAREDRAIAERLARALASCGWTVWWDRHIPAGRRFDEVISERLAAADCILALWSKAAIHSEWVAEEAEEARERDVLVPAMIEEVEPPLGFRRIHAADLIGWDGVTDHAGFDQLIEDIKTVLQRKAAAHPGPAAMPTQSAPPQPISITMPEPSHLAMVCGPPILQLLTQRLAENVGPIARIVVARAMREAADLATLIELLAQNIVGEEDRQRFVRDARKLIPSPDTAQSALGATMANPRGHSPARHLAIAENSLGEIEKALARHIGPIAKVILRRAVAQSGTADELCASLLSHIEREDDRNQFRATVTRLV